MKHQELLSAKDRELIAAHADVYRKIEAALRSKIRKLATSRARIGKIQETLDLVQKHPNNQWFRKALEVEMECLRAVPYIALDTEIVFIRPGQEVEIMIMGKKVYPCPE